MSKQRTVRSKENHEASWSRYRALRRTFEPRTTTFGLQQLDVQEFVCIRLRLELND